MRACLNLIKKNVPAYIEGRDLGKTLWDIVENINPKTVAEFNDGLDKWLAARQPINMTPRAAQAFALCQDQAATLRIVAENVLTVEAIKDKINSLFMDKENVRVPSVICSTVHKAKGLEAKSVYILASSFATGRRQLSTADIQEEQNIKYVAYTRTLNKMIMVSDN
jgi:superfamily I DNA/RNA helicase